MQLHQKLKFDLLHIIVITNDVPDESQTVKHSVNENLPLFSKPQLELIMVSKAN
jgi:hypothetical protein